MWMQNNTWKCILLSSSHRAEKAMVTPISFALQGTLVLLLQSHMVMAFGKRSELRLRVLDWVLGKAFLAQLIKNLSGFMANCCCLPSSHTSNLEIKKPFQGLCFTDEPWCSDAAPRGRAVVPWPWKSLVSLVCKLLSMRGRCLTHTCTHF